MLEDLQEKYFDEIRTLFPLHRIFLCLLGFSFSLLFENQTHKSIGESLIQVNISSISFQAGKLLENAKIQHVLIGIFLSLASWFVYLKVTKICFNYLMKKLNAIEKIKKKTIEIGKILLSTSNRETAQLSYFDKQSLNAAKKINRLSNAGELCLGISACFAIASFTGNAIDISLSAVFFLLSMIVIYVAILSFFTKFLKYDILRKALSNESSAIELPIG